MFKETYKFLMDFLMVLGCVTLVIIAFIAFNMAIDHYNPCSNFSDAQDLCEQSK